MFRPLFLFTIAALLPAFSITAGQPPDLIAPPSNAALVYWRGISLFKDLSKDERALLSSLVGCTATLLPAQRWCS